MDWDPQMCRICLTSSTKYVDLRTSFDRELTLLDILNLCTNLKAKHDDDLPKNLCQTCLLELEGALKFYQKAKKSDELLRSHTDSTFEPFILKDEVKEEFEIESETYADVDEGLANKTFKGEDEKTYLEGDVTNSDNLISFDVIHYEDLEKILPMRGEESTCYSTDLSYDIVDEFEIVCNESDPEDKYDQVEDYNSSQNENIQTKSNEESKIIENDSNEVGKNEDIEKNDKCCPTCGKSFDRLSTLEMHVRLNCKYGNEVKEEEIECNLCGKLVKRKALSNHRTRFHSNGRSFLCNVCPKRFFTHDNLKVHLKTHDKKRERNFSCGICSKAFFEKRSLIVHERLHTGIKPFECTECGKKFFTPKALENHTIVHNREIGKHKCNVCDKKFASRGEVVVHMRFHTGIFPFKCDLCDKSFAVKSHYNYHIAKHKGVVYNCPHCQKQFTNRGSLTSHLVKHREKMPHPCPVCNKGYRTPFTLKQHIESHQRKKENLKRRKETGIDLET